MKRKHGKRSDWPQKSRRRQRKKRMRLQSVTKLRSFLRAVWSFIVLGDAPLATYLERIETCMGEPSIVKPCDQLRATDTGLFCGACGCPQSPLSDVRTKARMLDIKCPLDKW